MFYIYDSRAANSIGKLIKGLDIKESKININNNYDGAYQSFYLRCELVVRKIEAKYNIKLNCRELDNLLIEIANDKLR